MFAVFYNKFLVYFFLFICDIFSCSQLLLRTNDNNFFTSRTFDFPINGSDPFLKTIEKGSFLPLLNDKKVESNLEYTFVSIYYDKKYKDRHIAVDLCNDYIAGHVLWMNDSSFKNDIKGDDIFVLDLLHYIFGTCRSVDQVKKYLKCISGVYTKPIFLGKNNEKITPLVHFIISDNKESIIIEFIDEKIKIYKNEFNFVTNDPGYGQQKKNVIRYANLSPKTILWREDDSQNVCIGNGMEGLPGSTVSQDRFVRGSVSMKYLQKNENSCISLANTVNMIGTFCIPKGIKLVPKNSFNKGSQSLDEYDCEFTQYSVIIDFNKKDFYIRKENDLGFSKGKNLR